jgi:hypothetical protein
MERGSKVNSEFSRVAEQACTIAESWGGRFGQSNDGLPGYRLHGTGGRCLWATSVLVLMLSLLTYSGCSLFVIAGKVLVGDPKNPSRFKTMTGIDLTKGKHSLLILCNTPEHIGSDNASLRVDLVDGVTRRLLRKKVDVVNSSRVSRWLDDHGGIPDDLSEIAKDFEVDYIAIVDLQSYTTTEENSNRLLRGRSSGNVRVFKVETVGETKLTGQVFTTEFSSTYPTLQPIPQEGRSRVTFEKEYLDRVSEQLAALFYDARLNDDL